MQGRFETILAEIGHQQNLKPAYSSERVALFHIDSLAFMPGIPQESVDMVFADPPYLLSNNGLTCQNGRMVSVNKGKWDESNGLDEDLKFHETWISECKRILKPAGTLWISGTYHSIYQCGFLLQKTGFHLLNDIAWFKPNASPNLSCRVFTASHETLLWARKEKNARHHFDYEAMKKGSFPEDNLKKENTQMRSVWSIPTPPPSEKKFGKHPTQKPVALLKRIIQASTQPGDIIFDPFNGSGTTGVAASLVGTRNYMGCDLSKEFIDLTIKRLESLRV